jgi:glycosyltransferase involved in cell wall biosynthesis
MKVLHLLNGKAWGGEEQYALDVASEMLCRHLSVEVICRSAAQVHDRFAAASIPTIKLPMGGAFDLITPIGLSKILRHTPEPVVIHAHNLSTLAMALKARRLSSRTDVRVVMTRHSAEPLERSRSVERLLDEADALIFVSQLARDNSLRNITLADNSKVRVINNAIRRAPSTPAEPAEPPIIAFVGRIVPGKGLDVLIDALALITDRQWRLRIIGEGEASAVTPLIRRVRKHEIEDRVEWLGYVDDVAAALKGCSIGVLPSTVVEAGPLTVLEYMDAGLVPVATGNGAQRHIIDDGEDGLLVPPIHTHRMAEALSKLLDNPQERRAMARSARNHYLEDFSYDIFFTKLLNVYNQ